MIQDSEIDRVINKIERYRDALHDLRALIQEAQITSVQHSYLMTPHPNGTISDNKRIMEHAKRGIVDYLAGCLVEKALIEWTLNVEPHEELLTGSVCVIAGGQRAAAKLNAATEEACI